MSRILVIDDDPGIRRTLERRFARHGYVVETAESGEMGLERALTGTFDVIVSDVRMPGLSGLDVLQRLREQGVDTAMIIMTGFATIETAVDAMKLGAVDFIQKPFFRDELLMRVQAATERRQLARQVRLLQKHVRPSDSLDAMIGKSEAVERVREFVRRAAAGAVTVLITGETGTGKELVARAIHAESARAERPFVAVNCSALTETLLEDELFGHARGAFTGAGEARVGLIEHANGGTLFLDEIGTMPKLTQAKLLRVVEASEIRRVGENEIRRVDVRFVAATNTVLKHAVAAGEFREDLFYRLNVLHVHLPPLRERFGDVAVLSDHFLEKYGRASGLTGFTEPARQVLADYPFPGNVRELEHLVQRAVAVAPGPLVDLADFPAELTQDRPVAVPGGGDGSMAAARRRAERERILDALRRHEGDLAGAARDLRVSRTTLWRLMRKHEISDPAGRR